MEHQTWRRSKHVPLEALLRRMSRLAEQILMAEQVAIRNLRIHPRVAR